MIKTSERKESALGNKARREQRKTETKIDQETDIL